MKKDDDLKCVNTTIFFCKIMAVIVDASRSLSQYVCYGRDILKRSNAVALL